jgi:hypothetical protein
MRRATRTNVMLLAMVLLLGAGAIAEIEREKAMRPQSLTSVDLASVRTLAVRCKADACRARRFDFRGHGWSMREPYALPADETAILRLLAIARAPIHFRHPASELDASKIGLDPPQTTLEVGTTTLEIGTTDAINGDRYVRVGDTIALVRDRFSPFLGAAPESELDRHVVPLDYRVRDVAIGDAASRLDLAPAWERATASAVRLPSDDANDAAPTPIAVHLVNNDTLRMTVRRASDGYVVHRDAPALDFAIDEATAQSLLGK